MDETFTMVEGAGEAAREMVKRLQRDGHFCVDIVVKPGISHVEMAAAMVRSVLENLGEEWFVAARCGSSDRVSEDGRYTRFEVWVEKINKHEDN